MDRCAGCGYAAADHVTRDDVLRCPVCGCGEPAEVHRPVADPPSPLLTFIADGRVIYPCLGGNDTQLRHGKYREAGPTDPALYPEIITRDVRLRFEAIEAARAIHVFEVPLPPQVPARAPYLATEYAPAAAGLGRHALGLGWDVEALYWRSGDGTEGCAVRLAKHPLRAVATWTRAPGQQGSKTGWATDLVYAWRADTIDRFPSKINVTTLKGLIT